MLTADPTIVGGSWTGHYGGDGYQIANQNPANPGYASVSITASTYTWTTTTSDVRALQTSPNSTSLIASTYLAQTSFTIDVNLTDGNSHSVALYLLDWDSGNQRAETITVQDASSGASFPSAAPQSFVNFTPGAWASYAVKGHVKFIITTDSGALNAIVSGIFFGPDPSSVAPQSQTITFNTIAPQTVGTPLALTAMASSGLTVSYSASPSSVCAVSGTTASFAGAGNCTITASQAGNSSYAAATSVLQAFAVSGGGSGGASGAANSATALALNLNAEGNWMGLYGGDGYQIANETPVLPGYANVSITASTYTWTTTTNDVRAMQAAAGSRIASTYLAQSSFTIDVNLTDGNSHTVALYLLDWDGNNGRSETISVQDGSTGAAFPGAAGGQPINNFTPGTWAPYTVKGHVKFIISNPAQYFNVLVAGIFFGPIASTAPQSQTITFNPIAPQTVGTPLPLTATTSSGLSVSYSTSSSSICAVSGTTASFVGAGNCTITASQAGNSSYAAAIPVSQTFAVSGAANSATALALNLNAEGNWMGLYGGDGYQIANETPVLPGYANVSITASTYTWTTTTNDVRAMQAGAGSRIASTYLAQSSFTIDVNLTDGNSHTVALYLLDWDGNNQRSETISVQDGSTGAAFPGLAGGQPIINFSPGTWAPYTVKGHVKFTINNPPSQYFNVLLAGIFFGPASGSGSGPSSGPYGPNTLGPQVTVFTSGSQWLSETLANTASATVSGAAGVSALGDYDGDGSVDAVTFSNGSFNVLGLSGGGAASSYSLGAAGSTVVPTPGDYDGDGKADYSMFDPSTGIWYYAPSGSPGSPVQVQTNAPNTTPIPGDYDGDGKTDIAYYTISNATFNYLPSGNPAAPLKSVPVGNPGDLAVVGDYDGDGTTDLALFRPSTGVWYYRLSSNINVVRAMPFPGAQAGDVPVPGDYDGDGKTDFALWRASNQTYYVILSSTIASSELPGGNLGSPLTIPIAGSFATAMPLSLTPFTKAPGTSLSIHQTVPTYTLSGAICLTVGPVNKKITCPVGGTSQLPGVLVTLTPANGPALQMLTDSNGTYSFTVAAGGSYAVTPSLNGYMFQPASNPNISNLTMSPLVSYFALVSGTTSQTISFPAIANQSAGTSLNLGATASSNLPIVYFSETTGVCTVSGSTASLVANGTCTLDAYQDGNGNYAAAQRVQVSFSVGGGGSSTGGSLSPSSPSKEYIFMNGQVIAIDHPH